MLLLLLRAHSILVVFYYIIILHDDFNRHFLQSCLNKAELIGQSGHSLECLDDLRLVTGEVLHVLIVVLL